MGAHQEERAAPPQGQQQQQPLPDDALQAVFERLPLGEQAFTVSALSREWRRRARPRQLELQEWRQRLERDPQGYRRFSYCSAYTVPLWLGQRAWPALTVDQRTRLICRAARHGDASALRWMWAPWQRHAYPWPPWVVYSDPRRSAACEAAVGGHVEVLQLLRQLRPQCELTSNVCSAAAEGGHLPALRWLRVQGPPCPWNADVCGAAAGAGHLAVLQWLRAQQPPCPWYKERCLRIATPAVRHWIEQQPGG